VAARARADVPGLDRNDALERALAILEKATGDAEGSPVTLDLAGVRVDEEVLATVREALDRQRRLHLRYLNEARDEVTERDVDPLTLHLRDGRFYLEGWCYRAEAMRLFRLDRVETVHVLDTPVDPPAQAQTLDLTAGTFTPSPEDFLVELELAPAGRWVVDYYPVEDVAEAPDGTLRVRLRSSSAGFARRLALRLGTEARVLSPAWLVSDVRKSAGQALAAYRPPSE
jgi:proteasome accessory factor C